MARAGRNPIALAALLSLALNLAGAGWGLPHRWHPDEKADVVATMASTGDLRPDSYINPSLPLYAMLPAVAVQQGAARLGLLRGGAADPLLAGRVLSALCGAAAVWVLGAFLGRRRAASGTFAALALALAPGFVNLCHFATPEAWLLLATSAVLAAACGHLEGRTPAWGVGLALGLALSTKYTAVALAAPALLSVVLAPRPERTRAPRAAALVGVLALVAGLTLLLGGEGALAGRLHLKDARLLRPERAREFVAGLRALALVTGLLLLGAAALSRRHAWAARLVSREVLAVVAVAGLAFLLTTPGAAVEWRAFLSDLAYNHQTRFEYKGLTGETTSYLAYLGLLADAFTLPLLAAAALGVLVATGRALRGEGAALVLLAGAVAPYLLVASSGHRALRFLAPALPALAGLAGVGLLGVTGRSARRVLAAVVLARAALGGLLVTRLLFVDSRSQAAAFLARNVPPGATIDLIANHPGYAPPAPAGRSLRVVPVLSREMAPPDRFAEAARRYPREASAWLVLTDAYYQRFLDHPHHDPARAAFFRDLLEGRGGFEVAARFRQQGAWRPAAEFLDPEVVVLRRREGGVARRVSPRRRSGERRPRRPTLLPCAARGRGRRRP
jgi:MFS family permease